MKKYKSLALAALCLALPALSLAEDNDVEIYLSAVELDEIYKNPQISYVCLNNQISNLENVINEIDKIYEEENSPLKALKKHIELGYTIGREDAVLQVLTFAQEALEQKRSLLNNEEAQNLEEQLTTVINQIEQGAINLDANKLAFLQEEFYRSQELDQELNADDQTDDEDQDDTDAVSA